MLSKHILCFLDLPSNPNHPSNTDLPSIPRKPNFPSNTDLPSNPRTLWNLLECSRTFWKLLGPSRIYTVHHLEQIANNWDGICKDSLTICEELNIFGLNDPLINKRQFKKIVKDACIRKNEEDLIMQISSYKKMSALRDEIEKGKNYFYSETLKTARTIFPFRVDLFEAKFNFKGKTDYKREKYLCDSCESSVDVNSHVLFCCSYATLREDKNLNNDSHLAEYLQKVLEIRTKLRLNR